MFFIICSLLMTSKPCFFNLRSDPNGQYRYSNSCHLGNFVETRNCISLYRNCSLTDPNDSDNAYITDCLTVDDKCQAQIPNCKGEDPKSFCSGNFKLDENGLFIQNAIYNSQCQENPTEPISSDLFQIKSPINNQIIGAGRFIITFDSFQASELEKYTVYFDSKSLGETTDPFYQCYTTTVAYHSIYVIAKLKNGTEYITSTVRFGISKKGLGLATDMGEHLNLEDLKLGWYYNWGNEPSTSDQYKNIEFVPMLWRETQGSVIQQKLANFISMKYQYVLAFNEPDMGNQCNMDVDSVLELWPYMMNEQILVSSPVTALWPKASPNWFQPFMSSINDRPSLDVDFISIHCYPDNFAGKAMAEWFLGEVVDWAWETYHKPIWITEFSTIGHDVNQESTKEFWVSIMPELDKREYVERYAAFGFSNENYGLWTYSTGELTESGKVYRDNGNPTLDAE